MREGPAPERLPVALSSGTAWGWVGSRRQKRQSWVGHGAQRVQEPPCPHRDATSFSNILFLLTLKKTPFVNRNPFTDFPDYKNRTCLLNNLGMGIKVSKQKVKVTPSPAPGQSLLTVVCVPAGC